MASETSFWRRQFADKPTDIQWGFDLLFGAGLPAICVCFDPVVFWSTGGDPLLDGYQPAALWTMLVGVLALLVWLLTQRFAALMAGILAGCGLFAFGLGLVLLPLSVVGTLFAGIGLLGLIPFATAFVFGRNAVRAWAAVRLNRITTLVAMNLIIGLELVPVTAYAVQRWYQHEYDQAVNAINSEALTDDASAIRFLRWFGFDRRFEVLARQHRQETDAPRRSRIAAAYLQLTGVDLNEEESLYWLYD